MFFVGCSQSAGSKLESTLTSNAMEINEIASKKNQQQEEVKFIDPNAIGLCLLSIIGIMWIEDKVKIEEKSPCYASISNRNKLREEVK